MRIAISGSHRSGKSTLVERLSAALRKHTVVEEPYHVMAEDGYEFSNPPSLEDFLAQLEHSIASLSEGGPNVLFDRCPVDFLAYISVHDDAAAFDFDEWIPQVRSAIQTLDLIVFVPIEARDRIAVSTPGEDRELRKAVDEKLREILLEDPFELDVDVIEVEGEPDLRARYVLDRATLR
jgi:hypothetical protein